jgi:PIN domain nuclease of toxin-antitoxin system
VTGGRILDSSAILDIARRDTTYGAALLTVATDRGLTLAVPAAALLEAWARSTPESRPFLDLLPLLEAVEIHLLDDATAAEAGALAADAGRPTTSAGTAQAVRLAQTRPWPIVTADPESVLALDLHVAFESLP